jgi:tetratricopeptide (TPR) repeat protein
MKQKKQKNTGRILAAVALAMSLSTAGLAQLHTPNLPQNKWLILAEEQFLQGHFALARQSAQSYLQQPVVNTEVKAEDLINKAKFFSAVSALRLDLPGAEDTAITTIHTTSNPAYKQRAAFALAQFYFRHNRLTSAIPYYELAGYANLSNKEIADSRFELAYCYFNSMQFDMAEPMFASIKELPGKYHTAGNYYYGLLAYNKNNYQDALSSFERIKNQPEYSKIVPYYIAEIYYFTGNRQQALNEALALINQPDKSFYDNELHLLAAQVLFEEERYGDALPYFEHYYDNTDKIRKEDLYEMGYSYYRVSEWQNAIEKFKPLSNTQDTLGQTAMYLLGDCYLKTGDKRSAMNAFGICADMPFNPAQRESSLLLAGKLSYELGYNDEAMQRLSTLLADYPSSQYKDEAKTLQSDLMIKSSNYAEAYYSLKDVKSRNDEYYRVRQKVAFGYAMQQLQLNNADFADELLTASLERASDPVYEAAANFWKGELSYRKQRYEDVIKYSNKYVSRGDYGVQYLSPAATKPHAYMNMGYAAMELGNYTAAQDYFSRAQDAGGSNLNATVREADAHFMQKNFSQAASLYDKVIASNSSDADYARYQKSLILGLLGRSAEKTALLQSILNAKPASMYAPDARYEMGLMQIEADKYQAAISTLQPLTEPQTGKALAPKAWMRIGFAYQQLNNNNKAIDAYKQVVSGYPSSAERPAALEALRGLYIETNQPSAYAQLLKDNNLPAVSNNSIDSTYYSAAEAQYASGKWDKAEQAFGQYLSQYPNGAFTMKAHYYRGESYYQQKKYKEALEDYKAVLQNPWNEFSESSARRAAIIAYQEKDYNTAFNSYQQLRNSAMDQDNLELSYRGLMKSAYHLGKFSDVSYYADTLMTLPDADEATVSEAQLFKAKSMQHFTRLDEALAVYKQLENAKNNNIAAEARYEIAAIYLQQNKLKEAEEAASKAITKSSGSDIKAFLLMADILTRQKDYFNAKATLQSVIKNSKDLAIKQEAGKKLEEVKALERKNSKLSDDQ